MSVMIKNGHDSSSEAEGEEYSTFKNVVPLEDAVSDSNHYMTMFFDGKYERAVMECMNKSSSHMLYAFGTAAFKTVQAIAFEEDKEMINDALDCLSHASKYAKYFMRSKSKGMKNEKNNNEEDEDYNSYSEEESTAELICAISSTLSTVLAVLVDKTFYGAVQGTIFAKAARAGFKKCMKIAANKTNWTSEDMKINMETGAHFGMGMTNLLISILPDEIKSTMKSKVDQMDAVEQLMKAADEPESGAYIMSVIMLALYHGVLQFSYEVGEPDLKVMDDLIEGWREQTPNSKFVDIFDGLLKQVSGQVDDAIQVYQDVMKDATVFKIIKHVSYRGITHCCIMKQDWEEGLKGLQILRYWRGSPGEFSYLYAVFLLMKMQKEKEMVTKEEKDKMLDEICQLFKAIPDMHRDIGWKMIYHEKTILANVERFKDDPSQMFVPILEVSYIWNIFSMMNGNKELLNGYLDLINGQFEEHQLRKDGKSKSNLDKYAYLTFFRGVMLRHLGSLDEAIKCFDEVLSCKKRISSHQKNLLPQSCFELGMVHRKLGHWKEAKEWFKKARNDYKNYTTVAMVQHRTETLLIEIRKKMKESK